MISGLVYKNRDRENHPSEFGWGIRLSSSRLQLHGLTIEKCQGGDSNPYGFLHQILSLARLPIPPPWRFAMLTNVALLAASGKLRL